MYGSIGGRITYATSHKPVGNVVVGAYEGTTLVATTISTANGGYALRDLSGGSYKLYFYPASGNGEASWYKNQPSIAGAVPVNVSAGKRTAGIDQMLLEGGTISGRVTRPAGTPEVRVKIQMFAVTATSVRLYTSASAEAGSAFRLPAVPAGTYLVEFGSGAHAAWYAGAGRRSVRPRRLAKPVTLTSTSRLSGINGSPYKPAA